MDRREFLTTAASAFVASSVPITSEAEDTHSTAQEKIDAIKNNIKEGTREELIQLLNAKDWYYREASTQVLQEMGYQQIHETKNTLDWKHELTVKPISLEQQKRLEMIYYLLSREEGKLRWDGIELEEIEVYKGQETAPYIEYINALNTQMYGYLDSSKALYPYNIKRSRSAAVAPFREGENFWDFVKTNLDTVRTHQNRSTLSIEPNRDTLTDHLAYHGAVCAKLRYDHKGIAVFFETDPGVEMHAWRFMSGTMTLANQECERTQALEPDTVQGVTQSPYFRFAEEIDTRELQSITLNFQISGAPVTFSKIEDLSKPTAHQAGDYMIKTGRISAETVTATQYPGTRYFLDCYIEPNTELFTKKIDAYAENYFTGYKTDKSGNKNMLVPDDNSGNVEAAGGRSFLLSFTEPPEGLFVRLPEYSMFAGRIERTFRCTLGK